jgi:hypothetical protein
MTKPSFQEPTKQEVTFSPAGVTEFPYFCLSRKPAHLKRDIEWQGTDCEERPLTWNVKPNSNGLPGEAAWEIWMTIIQPLLHAHRPLRHGMLIPLGGVRHCLRALDWTISGANAKVLTNALNQIAGATIEYDIWLPLQQSGPQGETHRRVRGRGPRIMVYSIGEYQLTESDIQSGRLLNIHDLNDVISIRVALEADLQQNIQYRPLDQVYARSVTPSARRWYELTASAVFGAVSHPKSPGYFDIRYSWYVSRHHTLEPQTGLRRIKMQMEKITSDHLKSGYLQKIKYSETPDGSDAVIRYYPGAGAKRSIGRIKSLLSGRRGLVPVDSQIAKAEESKPTLDNEAEELILKLISEYGVIAKIARRLVEEYPEEARKQLEAFPYRKVKPDNPAAFLVQSIRERWALPEKYEAGRVREEHKAAGPAQTESERIGHLLTEVLECLQQAGTGIVATKRPVLYDACCISEREIAELRDRIAANDGYQLEEVENRLTAAEDRLTAALWQSTDPDELDTLLKSASAELHGYEARMEPEVFNDTLRRQVTARLREQHRIPRLSLFYL